ncbi:hypothetical protein Tco_1556621 [Tanacetum coccineum]
MVLPMLLILNSNGFGALMLLAYHARRIEFNVPVRIEFKDADATSGPRVMACDNRCVSDIWLLISSDVKVCQIKVPVPLLEDPYEAIRQAYLDGTDTESEPFEDPIDTETPELPLTIAPPTSLSESTPPVLVPILCRTARMAVRVLHAMSSGLSASMAKVTTMSESAFRKRFWSYYESSPSVSPPDLPSRKRYRGTSELLEDSEEDDNEEDEEIEESIDTDSIYGLDDENHGMDDESHGIDDECHIIESDGLGLEEEEEVVPGVQQQAALVGGDSCEHAFKTWGSGSAPESERPERVSASRQPTLSTWTDSEDGSSSRDTGGLIRDHVVQLEELSPAMFERYDRDIGELFTRLGAIRDEIFSQRYRFRSLEYEHQRVAVTFREIWRLVLALESWAGQTDAQRAALWHAISDIQGAN